MAHRELRVGDPLPSLAIAPVSRLNLALFAVASGDHHPIHIDLDYALSAGFADVFAHGMLGMAWLGRCLTNWQPQGYLRNFTVRFGGITHLGHQMTCRGKIVELNHDKNTTYIKLDIEAVNQFGEVKIAGEADFALPFEDS